MKQVLTVVLAVLAVLPTAEAGNLYRWIDASGVPRYGYQPPPGVEAEPAEEERREAYNRVPPVRCEDLAKEHIAYIDREIARVRELKAGLGPEFQLTPSARQQLILDLLAHRAAMVTGRLATEFKTPSNDELLRARNELEHRNELLAANLQSQQQSLDAQKVQLERARRKYRYLPPFGWGGGFYSPIFPIGPGFYPYPYSPIRR